MVTRFIPFDILRLQFPTTCGNPRAQQLCIWGKLHLVPLNLRRSTLISPAGSPRMLRSGPHPKHLFFLFWWSALR